MILSICSTHTPSWYLTVHCWHTFSQEGMIFILYVCTSSSESGFNILLVTPHPSDSITPSVLKKILFFEAQYATINPILISVAYRIFHIPSVVKILALLQLYTMNLTASLPISFLCSIVSTHFHGHTLEFDNTSVLIQLFCSQNTELLLTS